MIKRNFIYTTMILISLLILIFLSGCDKRDPNSLEPAEYPDIPEVFIDGFHELAQAHENNDLSRESVDKLFADNFGQLPIMKTGQSLPAHTHPGAVASAVFYLTDVDNEKDGGQLVLRDPSWHTTLGFRNNMEYEIGTKAGRLIVFPVHIWHEVRPYFGKEDRVTIVANLSYINPESVEHINMKGD